MLSNWVASVTHLVPQSAIKEELAHSIPDEHLRRKKELEGWKNINIKTKYTWTVKQDNGKKQLLPVLNDRRRGKPTSEQLCLALHDECRTVDHATLSEPKSTTLFQASQSFLCTVSQFTVRTAEKFQLTQQHLRSINWRIHERKLTGNF